MGLFERSLSSTWKVENGEKTKLTNIKILSVKSGTCFFLFEKIKLLWISVCSFSKTVSFAVLLVSWTM